MKILKKCRILGGKYDFYYPEKDKYIGGRIALEKYEPYFTKLLLEQIKLGTAAVDVGANIGYDTVLMAEVARRVYSFEPEKEAFEVLQKNTAKLGNVTVVKAAAGNKKETIKLYRSDLNLGDHRLYSDGSRRKTEEIRVVRLDDEIKEKVALIKIDTQGYEPQVIEGAKKIIARDKPTIMFEYWPWGYKKSGGDSKKMMEFLEKIYGGVYFIDEYIQVYVKKDKKWIDNYCRRAKGGDCNLMVTTKRDYWGQIKDFWTKKWIKRKLGYPLT